MELYDRDKAMRSRMRTLLDKRGEEKQRQAPTAQRNVLEELNGQVGNRRMGQILQGLDIMAKLNISQPGDPLEREADRVARQVINSGTAAPVKIKAKKSRPVSRKPGAQVMRGAAVLASGLNGLQAGTPLTKSERSFYESRMDADFSGVRVHTGPTAEELAKAIDARAFTYNNNIVFGKGEYAPNSHRGRELMAHELAHVVQGRENNTVSRQVATTPPAPKDLAEQFRAAIKGWGTDEKTIYKVLSNPPTEVRKMIDYYNTNLNKHTGNGFMNDLYSELSGKELKKALQLLLLVKFTPKELAERMENAFKGAGTIEEEVFAVLQYPEKDVRAMVNYYDKYINYHGKYLIGDLKEELSETDCRIAYNLLDNANLMANRQLTAIDINTIPKIDSSKVFAGVIVRGKYSLKHAPGVMEQHADMFVTNSSNYIETRGFFGGGGNNPGSSGASSLASGSKKPVKSSRNGGSSYSTNNASESIGVGLEGISADRAWFDTNRRHYVDAQIAAQNFVYSTVILLEVTTAKAALLIKFWDDLKTDPGTFIFAGRNCSTLSAKALEYAGIISGGIKGLDTPDALLNQLKAKYPSAKIYSGFIGYSGGNGPYIVQESYNV